MKELIGVDLFDLIQDNRFDALCITTNCSVNMDGTNPMGGGCAGAAARRWESMPLRLGHFLLNAPNVPCCLGYIDPMSDDLRDPGHPLFLGRHVAIWAFPTMPSIGEPASLDLVTRSASLMMEVADAFAMDGVALPRPGCGIGGLSYEDEVKPLLEDLLDDRFYLIHKDGK